LESGKTDKDSVDQENGQDGSIEPETLMEGNNSATSSYSEEKDDDGAITSNWASDGANSVECCSLPGMNGEC
jgi:hypothetical protein